MAQAPNQVFRARGDRVSHASASISGWDQLSVGARADDAGVVEEMGPGVSAVAGNSGVRRGPERQVGAEEGLEPRAEVEVAGRGGAQQPDEGLGDDPAADGTEGFAAGGDP